VIRKFTWITAKERYPPSPVNETVTDGCDGSLLLITARYRLRAISRAPLEGVSTRLTALKMASSAWGRETSF